MSTLRALALLALACLSAPGGAEAQTYPSRPITMFVAFPPGGVDDAVARIIQPALAQALNQTIVIENVGGAGGMIAASRAARAEPDGYTILMHQDALAAGMTLYKDLTFDAVKDFVPIGLINNAVTTFAARPTLPANNLEQFLTWAKQSGHSIKFGHPGVGSFGHLADSLICQELGLTVTQVPYRGAGPALVDLLAGNVDVSIIGAVVAGPLVKAGKLKVYALTGNEEFAGLPGVKTFPELGYKKLDINFWHALFAPKGTPRPIIDKLNAALRTAMADPKVQKTFADGGFAPFPADQMTPEAAGALLQREIPLWGQVIKANHITGG
jgi:tripartite-type tricarboxylate transporter receptor subunit TctC